MPAGKENEKLDRSLQSPLKKKTDKSKKGQKKTSEIGTFKKIALKESVLEVKTETKESQEFYELDSSLHLRIAKELEIHKASILSNLMLK